MSGWTIYWITRLDAISTALVVVVAITGSIGAIAAVVSFFIGADEHDDVLYFFRKWPIKLAALAWPVLLLLCCLIPSTKEAAAIYLIPKIANNEQVQQVPDKAMQLLQGKLDEWISETAGKKEKK